LANTIERCWFSSRRFLNPTALAAAPHPDTSLPKSASTFKTVACHQPAPRGPTSTRLQKGRRCRSELREAPGPRGPRTPPRGLHATLSDELRDRHRWPISLSRHSHSIINSFCKPMIDRANTSSLAGLTIRCTATATGIPGCSIQHRSTSIENSRRLHDGQLSRSIGIYRLPVPSATA